jgi:hypothetical protein
MTGTRSQIHPEQRQAPALTTAVLLSPATDPSALADVQRPEAALLGMLGNSNPLLSPPAAILNCGK